VVFALVVAVGAVVVTRAASDPGAGSLDVSPAASSKSSVPAGNSADAGFARDMAAHHQQAVEMSFVVRDRTRNTDVRRLAYDIANTQANQRGMLLGWLDLWSLPKIAPPEAPQMAWMGHTGHEGAPKQGLKPKEDGLMPGMATRAELTALGAASDKQAEIQYLRLMSTHHRGGVAMAQGCAKLCTVPAERALAQGMVDAQQSELALMADLLKERGAKPAE
jgi:uncharacterized protein (DUF305 family)